jgi:hypothetical protein
MYNEHMGWSGGYIEWITGSTAYISVVFSWQLQKAYQRAIWLKEEGYHIIAGGPAVSYNPGYLRDVCIIGGDNEYSAFQPVIKRHNPDAIFTTRGCPRRCPFCIVSKIEPEYKEYELMDVLRPIVCDNNILASSDKHFNKVIDRLKVLKGVDFNQGLDARLMTKEKARRIAELDMKVVRLAWDHIAIEDKWRRAFDALISVGIPAKRIQSYVLIGYNDTPEDALYRLQSIKDLGAMPNPMRYQPLDAKKRNDYISPNWTDRQLKDYMRYWSRQNWLGHIPFEEYKQWNYRVRSQESLK